MQSQLDLQSSQFKKRRDAFGGDGRSKRKSRLSRPISTKKAIHLMLKSTNAKGAWSFLNRKNKNIVSAFLKTHAKRNGIQILSFTNVGNHLHIMLKVRSILLYKKFVRAFSGAVAMKITGASKSNKLKERFWTQTPFTRFVHGRHDFLALKEYFYVNEIEAAGFGRRLAEQFVESIMTTRKIFFSRPQYRTI